MTETQALARNGNGELALRSEGDVGFALTFRQMTERVVALTRFYKEVMQEGTDFGVIPGTNKPSLYQPGAQMLDGLFGLAPTFEDQPSCVRDYDRGFFAIDVICRLVNKNNREVVAEGVGHCNTKEDRYRWRKGERTCPNCGASQIIKGKEDFGGGWLCWRKNGGCGAKFRDGDAAIEGQAVGRVENDDPYSLANTIWKMAAKRAHICATLNATGAGRIFSQDLEDLPEAHLTGTAPRPEPQNPAPAPARAAQTRPSSPPTPPQPGRSAAREPAEGVFRSGDAFYAAKPVAKPPAVMIGEDIPADQAEEVAALFRGDERVVAMVQPIGDADILITAGTPPPGHEESPLRQECRALHLRVIVIHDFRMVKLPADEAPDAAWNQFLDVWNAKLAERERASERRGATASRAGR